MGRLIKGIQIEDQIATIDYDSLSNKPVLSPVATTGSYNDLTDQPLIGDGVITIEQEGEIVGSFKLNDTTNQTLSIKDTKYEEATLTSAGLLSSNDKIWINQTKDIIPEIENKNNKINTWGEENNNYYPTAQLVKETIDTLSNDINNNLLLKQDIINEENKLSYNLLDNVPTIPTKESLNLDKVENYKAVSTENNQLLTKDEKNNALDNIDAIGRKTELGEIFNDYINNVASEPYSHAEGCYTIASCYASHAEGICNVQDIDAIHQVGIGEDNERRKDAHNIKSDGRHFILGVGGFDGTNSTENDVKDLASVITNINNDILADKTNILNINNKIPIAASDTNQLADKAFVNSSIATNTATFRGQYTSIDDLPNTGCENNDYAFIKGVENNNSYYDRYKWTIDGWIKEYRLNNSSFTSDQWNAINSNATPEIIQTISQKYVKPNDGIPSTDFSDDVQASLTKANTALQNHQSLSHLATKTELNAKQDIISDITTIRDNASNGNTAYSWGNHADVGYLTEHQDISGKQDLITESNKLNYSLLNNPIGEKGTAPGAEVFNSGRNNATASGSHAEGDLTTASGYQSHAEGYQTTASGDQSHSEGYQTYALGDYSHAEGIGNVEDADAIHQVGVAQYGVVKNNRSNGPMRAPEFGEELGVTIRRDAHNIKKDGRHFILNIGGFNGSNSNETGVKDLASVIEDLETSISNCVTLDTVTETINDAIITKINGIY